MPSGRYGRREDVVAALAPDVNADYVGSPAIFATSTKPTAPTAGEGHLTELRGWVEAELTRQGKPLDACPIVAIGGVALSNAAGCTEAGAHGLAVVSSLLALGDLGEIRNAAVALRASLPPPAEA